MARTIAPGTPTPIEPLDVNVPDIDLSIFDQYGDYKIKSAMQNFQLYATTTANAEAQKAYQKYKNNPIALANALTKLPAMFNDLPKSVQADLKPKLDSNAISLVTKAQANQQAAINKQNKALAQANAVLNMNQLSDDYFNVLRYITSPDEEKRPIDMAIYKQHRAELERLTNITDENGSPLFSETQRTKMLMPKDATVAGFKQFVNRMESDQLKEWDEKIFQNQTQFMEDTNIDADTYESMENYLIKRKKALDDDKVRKLHGQAYYDATNLITEPTKLNIERAKATGIIPAKTIDKIVKASEEATKTAYYDPTRKTDPGTFVEAIANFSETVDSSDWSPNGREKATEQAAESLVYLSALAKEANMSPELVDKTKAAIKTAMSNKEAAQALDLTIPQIKNNMYDASGHIDYAKLGLSTLTESASQKAKKLAQQNYESNILGAMDSYIRGDLQTYNTQVAQADTKYKMDLVSFMPYTPTQWAEWQKDFDNGKDVIIEYNGNTYQFNGFNSSKPLTLINLI